MQQTSMIRKEAIIQLKTESPKKTLESIGKETDVSREYVRQVLRNAGVETGKEQPTCYGCSTLLYPSKNRPYVDRETGHRYCRACRHDMVWGTYSCHNCQKDVIRRKRDVLRATPKYIFCDKTCQGQYIGKNYGRKALKKAYKTVLAPHIEDKAEGNRDRGYQNRGKVMEKSYRIRTNLMPNRHKVDLTSRGRLAGLKHIVGHPVPDDFDPYEISWVTENIGVTSAEGADEAIKQGLFVINTAGEISNKANSKLDVSPGSGTVIQTLQTGVELMKQIVNCNGQVVVHCSMGMERSVLMVVWYLIRYYGMTFDTAYTQVRSARPIATDRRTWITA